MSVRPIPTWHTSCLAPEEGRPLLSQVLQVTGTSVPGTHVKCLQPPVQACTASWRALVNTEHGESDRATNMRSSLVGVLVL